MNTRWLCAVFGFLMMAPSAMINADVVRAGLPASAACLPMAQAGLHRAVRVPGDCEGGLIKTDRKYGSGDDDSQWWDKRGRDRRWDDDRRHHRRWDDQRREGRYRREPFRDNRWRHDDDDRRYRYDGRRDKDDDDDDDWRDAAVAAAVIGGVVVLSSMMDQNGAPPPSYGAPPSAVPNWAVGRFRGYNRAAGQQVELDIQPNGQVVGYAGGVPVNGVWNNGLLNMAGYQFEVIPQSDGFRTRPVGDASREVYYQRVY